MPTIDQPFRSKSRRPRPNPGPGRRLIQWPGDFTYLGAFKVNYVGLAGEHRYGRGLTYHNTRGNLLSTYGTGASIRGVYEFPVGTPIVGSGYQTEQYNVVNALKDYQRQPYANAAGVNLQVAEYISGDNGLGWDDEAQVLAWAGSDGYQSIYGGIGYGSLNYGATTGLGLGAFTTTDPTGYKSIGGGMVMIPSDYATSYLGGKRWAFGFGKNQSIVSLQDLSQGFSLVAVDKLTLSSDVTLSFTDCTTSGAGSTTLSTATGGFTGSHVGARVQGSWTGSNWGAGSTVYTIQSVTNSNSVVLNTSPSPGGAGSGGVFHVRKPVSSTPLVGFWPTTSSPGAGEGRMNRPDGETLAIQNLDGWAANKWTWVDNVDGCVWIDTVTRYGVLFCGRYAKDGASYLSSDVRGTYYAHFVGVYNPYLFAPVTGSNRYDIQPSYLSNVQWPVVNYTYPTPNINTNPSVGVGSAKTVSSITSDSSKTRSNTTGAIVNCTGHGYTTQNVRISGSSRSEHNAFWNISVIDANSFYIYNTSYSDLWSGITANNGGITASSLGDNSIPDQLGMAFDPVAKKLFVLQQVLDESSTPSDELQLLVMVYQLN